MDPFGTQMPISWNFLLSSAAVAVEMIELPKIAVHCSTVKSTLILFGFVPRYFRTFCLTFPFSRLLSTR